MIWYNYTAFLVQSQYYCANTSNIDGWCSWVVIQLRCPHLQISSISSKKCLIGIFCHLIVHNLIKKEVQLWKTNKQSDVMFVLAATTAKTTTASSRPSQLQIVTTVQQHTIAVTTKSVVDSLFCKVVHCAVKLQTNFWVPLLKRFDCL